MIPMRRVVVTAALGLAPVLALGGCSVLDKADQSRHMTAYFPKARSFYPHSKVKIMGADVGMVDRVRSMGDRIRVDFHVRENVPIARGVQASIVPLNLVGERNLVLHPVWRPGMAKETGDVIPVGRTHVPVETDEALKAFTNVANALDPTKTRAALGKAADSVNGNGKEFNTALEQGARLTENVAAQDKELLEVAENLSRLAGVVRGREQVLGTMIRDFGTATQVLAGERREIQDLVGGVLELTKQGDGIIRKYQGQLPYDLAVLTRVALTLQGDAKQLGQLLHALPGIGQALIQAYDPHLKDLRLRFPSDVFLRTWLKSLLNSDEVGCPLPAPNSNCPWQGGGK
jgi:phospholipid/cholesterol/gamma-HCH transport system substrate-binding protein